MQFVIKYKIVFANKFNINYLGREKNELLIS